jgi:hypothetical protein
VPRKKILRKLTRLGSGERPVFGPFYKRKRGPHKKPGAKRVYDRDQIRKEILHWAKDETSINIVGFCSERGYSSNLILKLKDECKKFAKAYELVKMTLAERRERLMNERKINYGAWARYQKHLDPFLSAHEDEEADKAAARQKGIAESSKENLSGILQMLSKGEIKQD